MYIGEKKQPLRMSFSTRIPISIINQFNCEGCLTQGFHEDNSNSYINITSDEKVINILKEKANGILSSDEIRLNEDDLPIHDFPFLLAQKWTKFDGNIDGIISI